MPNTMSQYAPDPSDVYVTSYKRYIINANDGVIINSDGGDIDLQIDKASVFKVNAAGTMTVAGVPTFSGALTVGGLLTASAGIALTGAITMATAASQIIPGATSFAIRNNANNANNLIVTDAGNVTVGANLNSVGGITVGTSLTWANYGTVTASGTGATSTATLDKDWGIITSDAITTAAAAIHTLTLTNSRIGANDQIDVTIATGTNDLSTGGHPTLISAKVTGASTAVIVIKNVHATQAINGTILYYFTVNKRG